MHIVIKMARVNKKQPIVKEWKTLEERVSLPSGVTAVYDKRTLTVKGPKGEISKLLKYPNVYIRVEGNEVAIGTERFSKDEKKIIFTYVAHLNNLIKGVTEGFEYNLVVVYAKFPITVELKGTTFSVKNLLGEKVPRSVQVSKDVKVEINGKDITVTGIDKELVGQTAANFEQLCRITHLDRRVIQDGIYITKKPHKRYS